jgi:hypothetical protein
LGDLVDESSCELLFRVLQSSMLGSSDGNFGDYIAKSSAVGYGGWSSDEDGIPETMVWG